MDFGTFFGPLLLAIFAAALAGIFIGVTAVTIGAFLVAFLGGLYLSVTWS